MLYHIELWDRQLRVRRYQGIIKKREVAHREEDAGAISAKDKIGVAFGSGLGVQLDAFKDTKGAAKNAEESLVKTQTDKGSNNKSSSSTTPSAVSNSTPLSTSTDANCIPLIISSEDFPNGQQPLVNAIKEIK